MILTTTDEVQGKKILKNFGLVYGNTIRCSHLGMDLMALLKNIVGGEVTEYTKLMAESREQAMDRMCGEAKRLGANAVVGIKFSTSELMLGAAELLVFGTAVLVENEAG